MRQTEHIDTWSGILVYLEYHHQQLSNVSKELIGEAVKLAKKSSQSVYGIAVGKAPDILRKELEDYPFREVFLCEIQEDFRAAVWEEIMSKCIGYLRPSIVLIGGTQEGRCLAPRVAVAFQTGLTADCTALEINEQGELIQIRPAFGGNLMARIVTPETRPQIATVRPGVMEAAEKSADAAVSFYKGVAISRSDAITIQKIIALEASEDITKEELLIVGGRGVREKADLQMLEELAYLLGGKLAGSRALVEKGWIMPSRQIGLSGHTVRPKCMITCGVSGTVQFMAGMRAAKNIIAVNSDPGAPIFSIAHYPICQDIYEVVPELIRMLKVTIQCHYPARYFL